MEYKERTRDFLIRRSSGKTPVGAKKCPQDPFFATDGVFAESGRGNDHRRRTGAYAGIVRSNRAGARGRACDELGASQGNRGTYLERGAFPIFFRLKKVVNG
jgi:hypothetical protein